MAPAGQPMGKISFGRAAGSIYNPAQFAASILFCRPEGQFHDMTHQFFADIGRNPEGAQMRAHQSRDINDH